MGRPNPQCPGVTVLCPWGVPVAARSARPLSMAAARRCALFQRPAAAAAPSPAKAPHPRPLLPGRLQRPAGHRASSEALLLGPRVQRLALPVKFLVGLAHVAGQQGPLVGLPGGNDAGCRRGEGASALGAGRRPRGRRTGQVLAGVQRARPGRCCRCCHGSAGRCCCWCQCCRRRDRCCQRKRCPALTPLLLS